MPNKDDLLLCTDITEIEEEYRELELEEARVDIEISEQIEGRAELETQFTGISELQDALEDFVTDIASMQESIDVTAANAGIISARARFLDREQRKIKNALDLVENTETLNTNLAKLMEAMKNKDIDMAAALINQYTTKNADLLDNPFICFIKSSSWSSGSHSKSPKEALAAAKNELIERLILMFETAAESNNTKEIGRCFKLFPLLGEEIRGLDMYSEFLCKIIGEKARITSDLKTNIYALRLTRLFEITALIIDNHFPFVEAHYGSGRMLRVIQRLQLEAEKRASMILEFFEEERHIKRRISQIRQAEAHGIKSEPQIKSRLLSVELERSGRGSGEFISDEEFKDISSILSELVIIGRQVAIFNRYLESRSIPEVQSLTDANKATEQNPDACIGSSNSSPVEGMSKFNAEDSSLHAPSKSNAKGTNSSIFLSVEDITKHIPTSIQNILENSPCVDVNIGINKKTGLITGAPLSVWRQWIVDEYIAFETYFISRSVSKVISLDDIESLSGWNIALSDGRSSISNINSSSLTRQKQYAESGRPSAGVWSKGHHSSLPNQQLDITQTSSCVGDLFFIIRTALEHAIAVQKYSAVEAITQYSLETMSTVFLPLMETYAFTRWTDEPKNTGTQVESSWRLQNVASSLVQSEPQQNGQRISDAARNQRYIFVGMNNIDLAIDYLKRTVNELVNKLDREWGKVDSSEPVDKAKKTLDTLTAFVAKLSHSRQRALDQLIAYTLKQRIRSILQQSYRDIKYVLTDEEFNDMQNDNLFQKRFILKLEYLIQQLKARLSTGNYAIILEGLINLLISDWERAIKQSKFNMLGGMMFEKDVREIQRYLEQESGLLLRPKFGRLVQMAGILAAENVSDATQIINEQAPITTSGSVLSNEDIKALLSNRIDIRSNDTNNNS